MTVRKSDYAKAYSRALKTYADWACHSDPTARSTELAQQALYRLQHWESHERELEDCIYCRRFPPLSH